jgi:hypothetical protein
MNSSRWDETWHRLREWTNGQGPSERLAAQLLIHEGYSSIDPSHPLGGRDGGKDATCWREGKRWMMAVYFPRGQLALASTTSKLDADIEASKHLSPTGMAFVTNQELTLSERKVLVDSVFPLQLDLYHLERATTILDAPAMAEVRKQFLGIDFEDAPAVLLGGQGGMAPGAGGGGGAAIGSGAIGGKGGPGGRLAFHGSSGRSPGAGGGGGAALEDNAVGGNGGGGGDQVEVEIGPEEFAELQRAGFNHIDFRVGQGGRDSGPGEDSIANFMSRDGKVLKSIVAKAGRAADPTLPIQRGRPANATDAAQGLKVSTLTLAECAQVKNGLAYLLGAGWEYFEFSTVPFEAQWPLVCTVEMPSALRDEFIALRAVVRDPQGFQTLAVPITVEGTGAMVCRRTLCVPLVFTGSELGVWSIAIESGDVQLSRIDIELRSRQ